MTTCPSGVDYRRLIDHAREVVETQYERPFADRWVREILAFVLPHRGRFRAAIGLAMLGRVFTPLIGRSASTTGSVAPKFQPSWGVVV